MRIESEVDQGDSTLKEAVAEAETEAEAEAEAEMWKMPHQPDTPASALH